MWRRAWKDLLPIFRWDLPDRDSITTLGKVLTLFIPCMILFGTIYLAILHFVKEETKYTISSESQETVLHDPHKVKVRCLSYSGCFISSKYEESKAKTCSGSSCAFMQHLEIKELDACYSPSPFDGVTVSWNRSDPASGKVTVLGIEIESGVLTSKSSGPSTHWEEIGEGAHIVFLGQVSRMTGLSRVGPVQTKDSVPTTSHGIFNADTLESTGCRQNLISAAGSEALLMTSASPFRTTYLRVTPHKMITTIKTMDPFSFLSEIGGMANLCVGTAAVIVNIYLTLRYCRGSESHKSSTDENSRVSPDPQSQISASVVTVGSSSMSPL